MTIAKLQKIFRQMNGVSVNGETAHCWSAERNLSEIGYDELALQVWTSAGFDPQDSADYEFTLEELLDAKISRCRTHLRVGEHQVEFTVTKPIPLS